MIEIKGGWKGAKEDAVDKNEKAINLIVRKEDINTGNERLTDCLARLMVAEVHALTSLS